MTDTQFGIAYIIDNMTDTQTGITYINDEMTGSRLLTIKLALHKPPFMQAVGETYAQYAHAILRRAAKVDGGSFFKILGRTCNLANLKAGHEYLRYHLVVEDEVVGIVCEVDGADDIGAKSAIAGVVFRELLPQHDVFKQREGAVENVLV